MPGYGVILFKNSVINWVNLNINMFNSLLAVVQEVDISTVFHPD